MSGRIPDELIAEIRDRTDIVQIIGQHVELKRAGQNHKGLCPFHQEKTPSFNVNGERQFFHCFGCQESGDVFTFLMKLEGRAFAEVVEDLAGRAGIDIPRKLQGEDPRVVAARRSERQRALDINAKLARRYRELLRTDPGAAEARSYLAKRGIGDEIAEAFQLGWAPPSGDTAVRLLEGDKVPLDFGERIGLVARRRNRPGFFDRFWSRLIFPLVGAGSEVLGFGGRLLADQPGAPKYVNTPETLVYHKGQALYGLGVAAKAIRSSESAILVEGNFDVLQLHQHGLGNAVAPMGTAVTESQLRLLHRFAPRVVAVFDGDSAGQAAARRAVPLFVAAGLELKVATLPQGTDPDTFLLEQGREAFDALLGRALPAIDFILALLQGEMEDTVVGRARVLEQIAPLVSKLESSVTRDLYGDRLAMLLGVDRRTVDRAMGGGRAPVPATRATAPAAPPAGAKAAAPVALDPAELDPLGILVEHPHLFSRVEQAGLLSLLTSDPLRATYSAAVAMQRENGAVEIPRLLQATPPDIRDAVANTLLSGKYSADGDPTRALDDCVLSLRRRNVDRELRGVQSELAAAQQRGDAAALGQLREQLIELIEQRRRAY